MPTPTPEPESPSTKSESDSRMREFIVGILGRMEGNAILSLASGRTAATEKAPHGKLIVDRHSWFAYPAELDKMVAFAEKAWLDRRDAYLSPIIYGDDPFVNSKKEVVVRDQRSGRPVYSRSKKNALWSQTIYMDSDTCPPEAFRIAPSRHVDTSEGHGHDYWFLPEPVPARVAAQLAHKITTAHKEQGTDPTGWSANKVLRLPTFNTGYDELDPFEVTWSDNDTDLTTGEVYDHGIIYDLDTLEHIYADVELSSTQALLDEYAGDTPLPPVPQLEGLPSFEDVIGKIPSTQRRLNDLIYKVPKRGVGGWQSEQRFALLLDLRRFGLTDEETIVVAWNAPTGAKWREDARGVDGLWWELQARVNPVLDAEDASRPETAPAPAPSARLGYAPTLLDDRQRRRVESRSDFMTLFMAYVSSKMPQVNAPLAIINGWTYLSLVLAEAVDVNVPWSTRLLGTNLYSISVAGSSRGKDQTKAILTRLVIAAFENAPDVAASSSPEALVENLIERDGRVTYIHENEFDGLLEKIMANNSYMRQLVSIWTRSYDGETPAMGRVGRRELNNSRAHAIPVMHVMGTPQKVFGVMDRSMFYSGWLARNIWAIGDDREITADSIRDRFKRRHGGVSADWMPEYLGSHFRVLRERLRERAEFSDQRAVADFTDEALELMAEATVRIDTHIAGEHDMDLWRPVLNRFTDIIAKIAGLQAASHSRLVVGTRDVEVALYYAEGWLANAMTAADEISDTFFSRQCDEIEQFIASQPEQEAEIGAVYRLRKGENQKTTLDFIGSLIAQGRVEGPIESKGRHVYRVRAEMAPKRSIKGRKPS